MEWFQKVIQRIVSRTEVAAEVTLGLQRAGERNAVIDTSVTTS